MYTSNVIFKLPVDERVHQWFFMSNYKAITLLTILYLIIVLKLGPKSMANRPPFELTYGLLIYNTYQVWFNIWLFTRAFSYTLTPLFFNYVNKNETTDIQYGVSTL